MSSFSLEFKEQLISKMLQTANLNIREFSEGNGVGKSTLYAWLKSHHLETIIKPQNSNPERWSGERKLNVIIETASLNEQELSSYCREHGLYPEQIVQWKASAIAAYESPPNRKESLLIKHEQKRNKQLSKELNRKEKALAEAAALLILRKKAQAIWGDNADE